MDKEEENRAGKEDWLTLRRAAANARGVIFDVYVCVEKPATNNSIRRIKKNLLFVFETRRGQSYFSIRCVVFIIGITKMTTSRAGRSKSNTYYLLVEQASPAAFSSKVVLNSINRVMQMNRTILFCT